MTFALAASSCTGSTEDLGGGGSDARAEPDAVAGDGGNVPDTGVADTGTNPMCTVADNVCPAGSSASNDPDCCMQSGGAWVCDAGGNGGCAVPGPFVPPSFRSDLDGAKLA